MRQRLVIALGAAKGNMHQLMFLPRFLLYIETVQIFNHTSIFDQDLNIFTVWFLLSFICTSELATSFWMKI